MEPNELVKLAKALPSTEVMVYKREDIEDIYLGKDIVAIYPKGKNASVPVPQVDLAKVVADLKAELNAEFSKQVDAVKAELSAVKAENEKLKAPAPPKSVEQPKVETKLAKKVVSERDILKGLAEALKLKED